MKKNPSGIFLNAFPVILMIGLILFIQNDYLLAGAYAVIIVAAFSVKIYPNDLLVFVVGVFVMTFFEYLFVSTGVEVFVRNSLLGVMPIWLPLLWGYGFVAIKRSIEILSR
jgi:hypothetical protein